MSLKPEASIGVGLATAALVYGIYNQALPGNADMRMAKPNDPNLVNTERAAAWTAAAVVGGVSLIAKDPTVFVIGAGMILVLSWWNRHDIVFNPSKGDAVTPNSRQVMSDINAADAGFAPSY